ncbi:MAG: coproporphyrinogen III oxidase [Alphaproteobacteria bacterium]|nr:coproporphyrinogen III oxidase [Alphaproteobacteria bacterium]
MPASAEAGGIGLYVHWPFCRSKCPYCDFNSHVRDAIDQRRWRAALLKDLDAAARGHEGRRLDSIFFGGGTPSLMDAETVAALLARARALFAFAPDIEITLEANPNSAEAAAFEAYARAGVNRLSLGVQALDDAALVQLGRAHGASEARAALGLARSLFPRFSFDLIYARPGQDPAAWRTELSEALALAGDHLSAYALTFEPGTPFHARLKRGEIRPPDEDTQAAMFEATREIAAAHGFAAYEVSNHARRGGESRHNLVYWRYADYLGIGPGAHGRERGRDGAIAAIRRARSPEAWLDQVEGAGSGEEAREALDRREAATEMLMMGLRLSEGVARDRFAARIGAPLEDFVDPDAARDLSGRGLLTYQDDRIAATAAGRAVLDRLLAKLLV